MLKFEQSEREECDNNTLGKLNEDAHKYNLCF